MPPALLLGGSENTLSVARDLGRAGVPVHVLTTPDEPVRRSRHGSWARLPDAEAADPAGWERFLLGRASDYLRGAVLLCCSDEAIELVIRRHEALGAKFVLEEGDPAVRLRLLDKLRTYETARRLGVATPAFWPAHTEDDLERALGELRFPVILKPLLSYEFKRVYGKKFLRADDTAALRALWREVRLRGLDVVVMEFVPGPDHRLCSYYTYLDADGAPLFHFTKRVLRRSPVNMGGASYHTTEWIPEAKEIGLRFLRGAGLRGLGNVELKRDERDGRLKLIECNARFTAANCLVSASGLDLAVLVYSQLTGGRFIPPLRYRTGLHLWNPWKDLMSLRELRRRGEVGVGAWALSLLRAQTFPIFAWHDPVPSLVRWSDLALETLGRVAGWRPGARPLPVTPAPAPAQVTAAPATEEKRRASSPGG